MLKKILKKLFQSLAVLFILINVMAYNHAYNFTHFSDNKKDKLKSPEEFGFMEKARLLFTGVRMPKSQNLARPSKEYNTIKLKSEYELEAWETIVPEHKGVVLLFHGYSSSKSSLIPQSEAFNKKGFTSLLIDFRAHGDSEGKACTVGMKESQDVKVAFDWAKAKYPDSPIVLFGTSMGAASVLKAQEKYDLKADKIIIECPFGSLFAATKIRFEALNAPPVPLAHILLFYGGVQTGFNPFKHKPSNYAKAVKPPTLLFYGAKDPRVRRTEIDAVYENLSTEKQLVILEESAHNDYLEMNPNEWNQAIDNFLGVSDLRLSLKEQLEQKGHPILPEIRLNKLSPHSGIPSWDSSTKLIFDLAPYANDESLNLDGKISILSYEIDILLSHPKEEQSEHAVLKSIGDKLPPEFADLKKKIKPGDLLTVHFQKIKIHCAWLPDLKQYDDYKIPPNYTWEIK